MNVNVNVKLRVRAGVVQEKVLRLVRLIDWIERTVYLCKVRSTLTRDANATCSYRTPQRTLYTRTLCARVPSALLFYAFAWLMYALP